MSQELEIIVPFYFLFFIVICLPFFFYVKKENLRFVFDKFTIATAIFLIAFAAIEAKFNYSTADFVSFDTATKIFLISNTIIFAPIAEEILFRSHVIKALEKFKANKLIVLLSALASSLLWSLGHYEDGLYFLVSTFFVGIALFFVRYKTKSIVNCIALHSASNSLGLAIMHIGS